MIRSVQLRLRPTQAQVAKFEHILADSCETYNAALQERRDAWRIQHKTVTLYDQFKEIYELRKDAKFATIASDIQREPLRRVDRAFKAFFRRCKAGQKPGFPRFRSIDRYSSFGWFNPSPTRDSILLVPKVGYVKFKAHRAIRG